MNHTRPLDRFRNVTTENLKSLSDTMCFFCRIMHVQLVIICSIINRRTRHGSDRISNLVHVQGRFDLKKITIIIRLETQPVFQSSHSSAPRLHHDIFAKTRFFACCLCCDRLSPTASAMEAGYRKNFKIGPSLHVFLRIAA